MTCRQFLNLTFAPRKTCHLSGSNLALHCYHATASVSYHMFPVIARDFSTFFADFFLENRGLFLTFLCRMTEPGNGTEKEMFSCSIKGLVTENISFSAVEFVNRTGCEIAGPCDRLRFLLDSRIYDPPFAKTRLRLRHFARRRKSARISQRKPRHHHLARQFRASLKKHNIPEHKGADDRYPPANSCKNEVKSSRRAIFDIKEIFYFPNQIRFCYQKNANSKHAEHLQYSIIIESPVKLSLHDACPVCCFL